MDGWLAVVVTVAALGTFVLVVFGAAAGVLLLQRGSLTPRSQIRLDRRARRRR